MPLSGRGPPSDLDGFLACRPELPEAAERAAGERSPGPADAAGADSFVSSSAETLVGIGEKGTDVSTVAAGVDGFAVPLSTLRFSD